MFASVQQLSTSAILGYLCVVAGFLIIVASVVFVIKGKAALSEAGAPNKLEWGKIKANLTSVIALFVVGAALIFVPFWQVQKTNSYLEEQKLKEPAHALLTGKVTASGDRNIRMLLVVEPEGEHNVRGEIMWQVPLLNTSASYRVYYLDGDTIVKDKQLWFNRADPGSDPQRFKLEDVDFQLGNSVAKKITPEKEVSDEQLKNLGIH